MPAVIAAGNEQTAHAGITILEQGGNAVDAAVAAAFASFIAEVGVVHLGGSGIAQIYDPRGKRLRVYDFFSNMPGLEGHGLGSDLDFERVTIDYGTTTQDFHLGRASVAVPGNIFGLCRLAADFGRLPLDTLLQPAMRLAEKGAVLDKFQADTCELLRPLYTHTESMRAIFEQRGNMVRSGDRITIPHLQATLQALARAGEDLIRHGALAQAILRDQRQHGGLLTAADLARYQVHTATPIRLPYRAFEVLLPPPSSTGGVLTAFALKLLDCFSFDGLEHGSAAHLQLLAEALAAVARARPLWDEHVAGQPWSEAIRAFLHDDVLQPFIQQMRAALETQRISSAPAEPSGPSNTSHLSVVDRDGMAVALTTTAGESAGYVVPETGFIPNNILGEADLNPAGFHRWQPGQRIYSMMTPTVVLSGGEIRLVTGSGGANRIRSAILQVLVNALDFDLPLEVAVNAPRIHVEDGVLHCEAGYDEGAVSTLERQGYNVHRWSTRSIYFGGAHSVARAVNGAAGSDFIAAGDNRRGGATATTHS